LIGPEAAKKNLFIALDGSFCHAVFFDQKLDRIELLCRCRKDARLHFADHKLGRTLYRQAAYLLTTDLNTPTSILIQAYFDRWQIEVNHREEKTTFGVGQAQVRNPLSVPRQPAFSVALYAKSLE
jgi:hypothetical protein